MNNSLNIIAGYAKGVKLDIPNGDAVRPTSVRARKAMFDSLGDLRDVQILDLFSGVGSLGLEAASRGASHIVFVEKEPKHCSFIKKNIKKVSAYNSDCKYQTYCSDALNIKRWLNNLYNFKPKYIFCDPPYPISKKCFEIIAEDEDFAQFAKNSSLYWELPDRKGESFICVSKYWKPTQMRSFGKTNYIILNRI